MNLSIGIVGLPNVGKSTLFNALLKKQSSFAKASAGQAGSGGVARVGNFAFTTIDPNVGVVPVPDERLEVLADIVAKNPSTSLRTRPPVVPAVVKFIDIAGIVKGASEGAGLGNKFLSHIREVSIICHVVRAFTNEDVIREGSVDVRSDYETIKTELILADLQSIIKIKDVKSKNPVKNEKEVKQKIFNALDHGIPVRDIQLTNEEKEISDQLFLISAKPEIIVLNVGEEDYTEKNIEDLIKKYSDLMGVSLDKFVVISAQIESELSELSENEQKEYLLNLGLNKSGLERLIQKAYEELGLISFLTSGEKEVRAWTIEKGTNAQNAAGVIHTDFIKNFIKAEVVSYSDFVSLNGWKKARESGKARMEGRDYIIKDGDVVEFKIGK